MKRDSLDLGKMNVPVLFKKFFVPTLLGMLSMASVTAIDGIFVGHGVGSDGIAAVSLCIPLLMVFTGFGLMLGIGSSVAASIHLSQNNEKAARLNATQALWFVTVITALAVAAIMIWPYQTAGILGSSENLTPMVVTYLLWFAPSLLFQIWLSVSLFIIRLDGSPQYAMWCNVIAALLTVALGWLFIFPLNLGLEGAALAATIATAAGGIMGIFYIFFKARKLRFIAIKASRKSLRLSVRNIGYQCKIGSSALLGEATLAALMFIGNQVFMKYLGNEGVGAFGIACYYSPFIFMIGNAIAQSAQPILSYNYGKNLSQRVLHTEKLALKTAFACGVVVTLFFNFFSEWLVELFLPLDNEAAKIAVAGLPLFSLGFICFIMNLTAIGYFQSLEKIGAATTFALLRGLIILVPAFYLLPMAWGDKGIWLAMPVSEILTMLCILGYYIINRIKASGRLSDGSADR